MHENEKPIVFVEGDEDRVVIEKGDRIRGDRNFYTQFIPSKNRISYGIKLAS